MPIPVEEESLIRDVVPVVNMMKALQPGRCLISVKVLCKALHNAFKKLKQNFQLHFFYSDTENGIKTQIWCTLIAHLLLNVIRVLSKSQKAFSTITALIRIHLISHLDLMWVVTKGRRTYTKRRISRNKSPATVQLSLF